MGFIEAIKSGYNRAFDFQGRSSRSEYWFWTLYQFLVTGALGALAISSILYMSSETLDKIHNDLDHKQNNHQNELMFKANDSDDITELFDENGNVDQEKLKDKVDKSISNDSVDTQNDSNGSESLGWIVGLTQVAFWWFAPLFIWMLVLIIPNISLSIRRLHDIIAQGSYIY